MDSFWVQTGLPLLTEIYQRFNLDYTQLEKYVPEKFFPEQTFYVHEMMSC